MPLDDAEITAAAEILLGATGSEGHFGYSRRNPSTGELEVVYAIRGPDAGAFLATLDANRRRRWGSRLLRSLAPRPGERD